MSSPLERIPSDVLHYITILAASSSVFDPPLSVLNLMQTRSTIHKSLSVHSAPHVYAGIFKSKFDTSASLRNYRFMITDSALTGELVNRFRLLQRCKDLDISSSNLLRDLVTAFCMYLESDGRNEHHLWRAGFPSFILLVARTYLSSKEGQQATPLGEIVVWLLCLALPRRLIQCMCKQDRQDLYSLIFPYIFSSSKTAMSSVTTCQKCLRPSNGCGCPKEGMAYGSNVACSSAEYLLHDNWLHTTAYRRCLTGDLPESSIAAINLACIIFESEPLKMPYHLPETRAHAIAAQLSGPTKEDFKVFASYETPLFADSMPAEPLNYSAEVPRSMFHDFESRHSMGVTSLDGSYIPEIAYTPGTITGIWIQTIRPPSSTDSTFAKPIQCALVEYVGNHYPSTLHGKGLENIDTSAIYVNQDYELFVAGRKFQKYTHSSAIQREISVSPVRRDVILLGETSQTHEDAWGAFKFRGVVSEDGRVVLKRSGKYDDHSGTLLLEGRLRFGTVFLGRWRITAPAGNADHGIFSMKRIAGMDEFP